MQLNLVKRLTPSAFPLKWFLQFIWAGWLIGFATRFYSGTWYVVDGWNLVKNVVQVLHLHPQYLTITICFCISFFFPMVVFPSRWKVSPMNFHPFVVLSILMIPQPYVVYAYHQREFVDSGYFDFEVSPDDSWRWVLGESLDISVDGLLHWSSTVSPQPSFRIFAYWGDMGGGTMAGFKAAACGLLVHDLDCILTDHARLAYGQKGWNMWGEWAESHGTRWVNGDDLSDLPTCNWGVCDDAILALPWVHNSPHSFIATIGTHHPPSDDSFPAFVAIFEDYLVKRLSKGESVFLVPDHPRPHAMAGGKSSQWLEVLAWVPGYEGRHRFAGSIYDVGCTLMDSLPNSSCLALGQGVSLIRQPSVIGVRHVRFDSTF